MQNSFKKDRTLSSVRYIYRTVGLNLKNRSSCGGFEVSVATKVLLTCHLRGKYVRTSGLGEATRELHLTCSKLPTFRSPEDHIYIASGPSDSELGSSTVFSSTPCGKELRRMGITSWFRSFGPWNSSRRIFYPNGALNSDTCSSTLFMPLLTGTLKKQISLRVSRCSKRGKSVGFEVSRSGQ